MKVRVLTAVTALVLASGAPPILVETLGALDPPLIEMQTFIQHINVLTS